jgi:serine/threonine protein kinase
MTDPTSGLPASGRRFQVHSCLGRGGFGEVYRATMMSSGGVRAEVAIKVLRGDIDPGSDSVKRLRDEGRLLGALRHPAILRVHDLVLLEERVALVTEYVEGDDLDRCMTPPMPVRALVGVVGEVAAALDVAWNAPSPSGSGEPIHLVHRDVKPANIRIGRHGEVKLLDFGIARATNVAREAQTANNAMMGSYLYMSPERFHEERVEPPADVYALGCILFEGLAGARLFDGMTLKQIYGTMLLTRKFNAHLQARFAAVPAETDPAVIKLMTEMLSAEPAGRPSAADVARRCEDLVEVLPGAALKRWARSREWPPGEQILGTLDGRELTAKSFGVSAAAAAEATFLGPPEPEPPLDDGASGDSGWSTSAGTTGSLALPPIDFGVPALGAYTETPAPSLRRAAPPPAAEPPLALAPSAPPEADVAGQTLLPPPDMDETLDEGVPDVEPAAPVAAPGPVAPPVAAAPASPAAPPPVPANLATTLMPGSSDSATPDPRPRMVTESRSEPGLGALLGGAEPGFDPITDPRIDPMPGVLEQPQLAPPSLGDEAFDQEIAAMRARDRRRNQLIALALAGMVGVVVLFGLVGLVYSMVTGLGPDPKPGVARDADGGLAPVTQPAPDVAPADVAPANGGVAEPAPDVAPAVAPSRPRPSDDPKPRPTPDPSPEPAPAEPAPAEPAPAEPAPAPAGNAKQLVEQGWNVVERDPAKALKLFEQAVSLRPDGESYYGYGYTLMQLGRKSDAQAALCKAVVMGDSGLQREVKSVMGENGLVCP